MSILLACLPTAVAKGHSKEKQHIKKTPFASLVFW